MAEAKVDQNVVYGTYSGLALLMDVHFPDQPNGYGIIHVSGSAWTKPLAYSGVLLTKQPHVAAEAGPLIEAGYTVFTVTHRATPRFQYPAPIEDVQRAARFIRYHAADYGIDPDRIGAMGGSSGGHLVSLLGVLDGLGDPHDPDPVNRVSSKVQAVVGRAVPADLAKIATMSARPAVALLIGASISARNPGIEEMRLYQNASPITYVSSDDPSFLFIHGDADKTIPYSQAGLFAAKLKEVGVEANVLTVPGGDHGFDFPGATAMPDWQGAMIDWFDEHLKR